MNRRLPSLTVSILLILVLFAGLDLSFDISDIVEAPTIYVDDDNTGPEDGSQVNPWNTIQEAVDDANSGDTVFVTNGTYYEDVYIDKTINLTGISRDNTTINATDIGIYIENADYVNISGFTIENASVSAMRLLDINNTRIRGNKIQYSKYGTVCSYVNNSEILDNLYSYINNYIAIDLVQSSQNTLDNNKITKSGTGISLGSNSNNNTISNNNCSENEYGLSITTWSTENIIRNNIFNYNNGIFNYHTGISLGTSANNNTFINNTIKSNKYGILANSVTGNIFINSTITQSEVFDIHIKGSVELTLLNSTFNKSSVEFTQTTSILTVQWYLHVNVIDYLGNPVPNVKVKIEDNINGSYNEIFTTDVNGYIRWLIMTEYIEQDINDDSIGEKKYNTPHQIIAWNDTLVGYSLSFINESKNITIMLYNGTLMDLKPGWNLISLSRTQSITNPQTILQSIEGRYNSIQWYNRSDNNDPWKHYHISKPSNLNDLNNINHTIGFWIYICDPFGTTLVVFGEEFSSNQNISLFPGWNLVGYPSKSNKTRDIALNTIFYGTDVDAIWTYNCTNKKWIELNEVTDYFEIDQGYWIHSKVTKIWIVPL